MEEKKIQKDKVRFFQKHWVHIGLIILLTFGVYANSFKNEFVYDDEVVIVENNFIKDWKNFPKIFTKDYFVLAQEVSYRPICTLSFFIDYSLWKLNTFGWHLTNICFHTANAIIIYFLIRLMFSYSLTSSLPNSLTALLTALFFALHPVQTEAVNGISFREDLISFFFFFLLAFHLYLRSTQTLNHQSIRLSNYPTIQPTNYLLYFASLISFIFALFSKEMAIILPLALILYEFCFGEHIFYTSNFASSFKHFIRKYFFYFLIIGFYLYVRFFLFKPQGIVMGIDASSPPEYPGGSFYSALCTMGKVIIQYLKLLFFPLKLSLSYDFFPISCSFLERETLFSFVILILVLFFALKIYNHSKKLFFSIFFFFISLLPVSNIYPFDGIMAERYLYFPNLGFSIFLVALLTLLTTKIKKISFQKFVKLAIIPLLLGYTIRTFFRNFDWRNELILYQKTIKDFPNSAQGHYLLGSFYLTKKKDYIKAIEEFKQCLKFIPFHVDSYYSLGVAYERTKEYDKAITYYRKAIALEPNYWEAHRNLGVIYGIKGMFEKASHHFKRVIEIKPNCTMAQQVYRSLSKSLERRRALKSLEKLRQDK